MPAMTVEDLINKLRAFECESPVILQFRSDGEFGAFDARSSIRSLVKRKLGTQTVVVIRGADEWIDSGSFT